jgi:hypothetical protein
MYFVRERERRGTQGPLKGFEAYSAKIVLGFVQRGISTLIFREYYFHS